MAKETESGLRKMQFTKTLRGYACDEVDAYFAHVNDRYVAVMRECSELKKKMAVVAASQNEFREDALREKAKIIAEADAVLEQKKAETDTLVKEAEQKAAMILSKAETAAAGILRQAEAEAESIRQKNAAQLENCRDAERKIRSHNNTADRLVAEIDSFREKVFAMYAGHIEALEQLGQLTDDFYKAKEELTIDTTSDQPEPTEPVSATVAEDEAPTVEKPGEVPVEVPDEKPGEEPGEEPVRIDWQEHRQKHVEKMAEKTLWEIVDEAEAQAAENKPDEPIEDDALDRLFRPAQPAQPEEPTDEDIWEEPVFAPETATEPSETEPEALPSEPVSAEEEEEEDLLAGLERDLLSAYAKDGVGGAEEAVDAFDLESLIAEDKPTTSPEKLEPTGDIDMTDDLDSEEDFLSDIASEYLTKAPIPEKPEDDTTPTDITATDADDLDELLDDEQSHDVSLTGEFDKIFSSKKSAAYVDEVSRQPLMEAAKPEKPKKHK